MEVSFDVRQSDENPQFPLFLENKHFFFIHKTVFVENGHFP